MKDDVAEREAKMNPQAYACLGVTFFAGFIGIFFGVFLTDLTLRLAIAGTCLAVFLAGIGGHGYFKKQETAAGFRPSRTARRAVGYCFGVSMLAAFVFAIFAVVSVNIAYAFLPVAYVIGIFPFVRSLFKNDEDRG